MTSQWDRFDAAVQRVHTGLQFRSVTVYQYTETYDSSTGDWSFSKSEDANSPVEMELTEPTQPTVVTDATGTDVEADARGHVADDTGISWTGADADAEHPTTVDDGGATYRVLSTFDEGNGLTRLELMRE